MAILFDSWLVELGAVLVTLFAGIYIYMSIRFQYWKKKGLPYLEPSVPFGNMRNHILQHKTPGEFLEDLYWKLDGHKSGGIYIMHLPALLIRDPELLKTIFVKDFDHFNGRGLFVNEETDPLWAHQFFSEGIKWEHMRSKMTPNFTSGKMEMMFPTVVECVKKLKTHLAPIASRQETAEVKDILEKYCTDVIATCAFGIESNCLKNPDSEFRTMAKKALTPTVASNIKQLITLLTPRLAVFFKIGKTPRNVTEFFVRIIRETIEYREKFQVTRNDFMQLLIGIKNKKTTDDPLELSEDNAEKNMYDVNGMTMKELAAQAFMFLFPGLESSSNTMSFCLYELALNQDIQDRLRDEVDSVLAEHGGEMTYEAVTKIEYLDRIVAETMRKYPPLPALNRCCTKEYQLPETDVKLEVGTLVLIPVHGLHHDPQYYPNPQEFDPERFTEEAKAQRHQYAYLPFGEGRRNCIGSRFGLMLIKICVASLISDYQLNVCKKLTAIPLVMDPTLFITSAKGGINLQITERINA